MRVFIPCQKLDAFLCIWLRLAAAREAFLGDINFWVFQLFFFSSIKCHMFSHCFLFADCFLGMRDYLFLGVKVGIFFVSQKFVSQPKFKLFVLLELSCATDMFV